MTKQPANRCWSSTYSTQTDTENQPNQQSCLHNDNTEQVPQSCSWIHPVHQAHTQHHAISTVLIHHSQYRQGRLYQQSRQSQLSSGTFWFRTHRRKQAWPCRSCSRYHSSRGGSSRSRIGTCRSLRRVGCRWNHIRCCMRQIRWCWWERCWAWLGRCRRRRSRSSWDLLRRIRWRHHCRWRGWDRLRYLVHGGQQRLVWDEWIEHSQAFPDVEVTPIEPWSVQDPASNVVLSNVLARNSLVTLQTRVQSLWIYGSSGWSACLVARPIALFCVPKVETA